MSVSSRKSRVAFVVVKLSVSGISYFLMRLNSRWKDINFIGGHEKQRDAGNLEKAARRELWEEVPPIREQEGFNLEALTEVICYGPVYSKSGGEQTEYELQFFLLKLHGSPENFVARLGPRTRNAWISQDDLLNQERYRISDLVKVLNAAYPGGISAIPYSSPIDLHPLRSHFDRKSDKQFEFALK